MKPDLTEIKERIQFCRTEIEQFGSDQAAYLKKHFEITQRINNEGMIEVCARLTADVPTSLRARAGTIANELRACLDALACCLALRADKTISISDVYFPISKSKAIFEDDGLKHKLKKLRQEDRDEI